MKIVDNFFLYGKAKMPWTQSTIESSKCVLERMT